MKCLQEYNTSLIWDLLPTYLLNLLKGVLAWSYGKHVQYPIGYNLLELLKNSFILERILIFLILTFLFSIKQYSLRNTFHY